MLKNRQTGKPGWKLLTVFLMLACFCAHAGHTDIPHSAPEIEMEKAEIPYTENLGTQDEAMEALILEYTSIRDRRPENSFYLDMGAAHSASHIVTIQEGMENTILARQTGTGILYVHQYGNSNYAEILHESGIHMVHQLGDSNYLQWHQSGNTNMRITQTDGARAIIRNDAD
ncbi:hypothetical protein LZ24_00024 [Desulfobotulus alkaliphilus]|uniref:Curlin associated repeat-containing protein n=1 Tax=Desulfobotulus alkaliphilus TaxID=622671 RepID=A0A562S907_9BACT|nr:hypothetical protein [Desulfobotulus alkaliphilus]TWI77224.1 hypothetical protein LZ24_00024 [Desulfobotulus alkaliphilus]